MMMMIDSKNVVVFRLSSWWSSHVEQIMAPSPKIIICHETPKRTISCIEREEEFYRISLFHCFLN
jgi:hypothetical protein